MKRQVKDVYLRRAWTALPAVFLAGALAGCGGEGGAPGAGRAASQTATQIFVVKGVVQELKPGGRTVVIRHEAITNYMPAMTMPFEVRHSNELAGIKPGDAVAFRMLVTEKEGWIDHVTRIGSGPVPETPSRETFRRVREVEPLNVGDPMPDYRFTNELGQAIHLTQFKGQALAFTFIYTRCPFPNFCIRMSGNFAEAQKKLETLPDAPSNWRLLSISFDPEHDTPEVLRNYGRSYKYDTNHWSFATGALIDIDAITEQFGLVFPREGVGFNHNLRTVVLDARGRIQRILNGNEWKVDELVDEIVKAAAVKP